MASTLSGVVWHGKAASNPAFSPPGPTSASSETPSARSTRRDRESVSLTDLQDGAYT